MREEDRKELVHSSAWREFRDWVKANVELESKEAQSSMEAWDRERRRVRRDTYEDVMDMVLAFEQGKRKSSEEPRV